MRILVIGNGYLASTIIEKLISDGQEVRIYSRTIKTGFSCEQIRGDIFDYENLQIALAWEPNVVINTVWITSPGSYKNDASNYDYARFAIDLAEFVRQLGVEHLIVLGSCAEYGVRGEPSIGGITALAPQSLYAEQKVVALNGIKTLLKSSSTNFTWARIYFPYGPNQNQNRLVPYLINSLRKSGSISLFDSTSRYDWITTRDIASGISWIISQRLYLEVDVGTSVGYTNIELLRNLEEAMKTTCQTILQMRDGTDQSEVLIASHESSLLKSGWRPMDTLSSGLVWILENE